MKSQHHTHSKAFGDLNIPIVRGGLCGVKLNLFPLEPPHFFKLNSVKDTNK
mgnify:CR=1 FL=1